MLNSREFYLDGVKRDRWVWSGDALQSYLIDRYCFFDTDIIRRTIIALRGNESVQNHINTILDYSFYWIISIDIYYEMTGNGDFVKKMLPRIRDVMNFCDSRLDVNGFEVGIDNDWVFIDWADIEKQGPVCAEQMLLLRAYEAFSHCLEISGESPVPYKEKAARLKDNIDKFFWDEEKGAYIDSFVTGNRHVTRHANIFAALFGYADADKEKSIIENVLLNSGIEEIKTPYFKFYELDVLCKKGFTDRVTNIIKSYWGGMLNEGATTFWEEYNPKLSGIEHYAKYGEKFHKSLCHAWGASPVYLLGKYYVGVNPTEPGYNKFTVTPSLGGLSWFSATVPVNGGSVSVDMNESFLKVTTDKSGGTLIYKGKEYVLEKNCPVIIDRRFT